MSFASENGYVPVSFEAMMELIMNGLNAQFDTGYTTETFLGSNHYKYFYVLVQRVMENQNKTAEIFAKLSQYISSTNLKIQRPSVSLPGLIDSFESKGYVISVAKTTSVDPGEIEITVQLDNTLPNYAAKKIEVAKLLSEFVVAGMVTKGTEVTPIVLSNGQSFDFKFRLPYIFETLLRLTVTQSENQSVSLPTDEQLRLQLFNNLNARYRLGWDFEPQRYMTIPDLPWASDILLEYSIDDGSTWSSDVYTSPADVLFKYSVEDMEVIIE